MRSGISPEPPPSLHIYFKGVLVVNGVMLSFLGCRTDLQFFRSWYLLSLKNGIYSLCSVTRISCVGVEIR